MPPDELTEVLEDYVERWPALSNEERMAAMALALRMVIRVDRRCGALVIEDKDGQTKARPARIGFDWKFVITAVLTLVTTGVVPYLIATHAG